MLRESFKNTYKDARNEDRKEKKEYREMGVVIEGEAKRTFKTTSEANNIFIAEWKLKNLSQFSWRLKITAMKMGGNIDFAAIESQGRFKPGELIDLNIPITAPKTSGKYSLQLVLKDEHGYQVAGPLNVELIVIDMENEFEELWWEASEMAKTGLGTIDECYNSLISGFD